MFQHAYDGYLRHASNYDELRPLSCDGVDTWGSYSLTLIDALDTLAVLGNYTEFRRVVHLLVDTSNFHSDINVSVFETNIRIVGGLLSAHLMQRRAGMDLEPGWPCNGPLLRMAEDVARRLLPAFDTRTGMPYGTVNLMYGVPPGETSVTCTACVGTFIVEFGALSRLTGDPIYEEVAMNALVALFQHRSSIGLFGNHIDVQTGRWIAQDAGIGAGVDSYFEYLVKGAIMLNRPELMQMFNVGRVGIEKYLKRDDWHVWVGMNKGQVTLPVFQSLEAYWPGVLSLLGEIDPAMRTLHNYHSVWKQYGFLPEFYNIPNAEAGANRENYPLRPELIESVMYLYRATGDPFLLQVGEDMLRSIEYSAKTACGYATIKNVRDHRKEDRMESFFLAETTNYLYLLFDPDNFLNNNGGHGEVIETPNGECVIEAGGYIFNTEAHPIDPAALRCCYEIPRMDLLASYNRKDYLGEPIRFDMTVEEAPEEVLEAEQMVEVVTNSSSGGALGTVAELLASKERLITEIMNMISSKKEESMKTKTVAETETREDDIILAVQKTEQRPEKDTAQVEIIKTTRVVENEAATRIGREKARDVEVESGVGEVEEVTEEVQQQQENLDDDPEGDDEEEEEGQERPALKYFDESQLAKPEDQEPMLTAPDGTTDEAVLAEGAKENSSMLTDFVETLLNATTIRPRRVRKFDPQQLLEKIRVMAANATNIGERDYKLLTCKAQPYLQRISVLGEFF